MAIEGQLSIDLYRKAGKVEKIDIRSSRPLQAVAILEGRKVGEVLELLPRLYSVCAIAQSCAAVRACEQTLGRSPDAGVETAREMLVLMETVREHLWRIALDWPKLLGEKINAVWAASLPEMLLEMETALFGGKLGFSLDGKLAVKQNALRDVITKLKFVIDSNVFGEPNKEWLERDLAAWREWAGCGKTPAARLIGLVLHSGWQRAGSTTSAFMPPLPEVELEKLLSTDEGETFVACPDWQGEIFETTSLARQCDQPLIAALMEDQGCGIETRLAAKLVELASIPVRLQKMAQGLSEESSEGSRQDNSRPIKSGIGQVEAARGRLVHWMRLEEDIVRSYRILAPTEWNFHPEGVVARGLRALPDGDEQDLRRMAALLIETVDPCVGYELTVH